MSGLEASRLSRTGFPVWYCPPNDRANEHKT